MHPNQVVAPGKTPADRKRTRTILAAVIGGAATLIGTVSGLIAITDYLNRDKGPAVYSGALDTATGMRDFLAFADKQDGKIVRLDIQCVYHDGPRSCVDEEDFLGQATVLLDLNADAGCAPDRQEPCAGSVVLYFFEQDTAEAQIDNGEFGAGSIVVKGYFTLSKRGNLGSLPTGATAIYLTAVPAEKVPQPKA